MECRICYENVTQDNLEILECAHSLCQSCLGNLRQRVCPFCRTPIQSPSEPLLPIVPQPPLILNIRLNVIPQPRRRRRRRRPRRRVSSEPQAMVPPQLGPDEINDIVNDIEQSSVVESKNDVSVSDNNRQHRRNFRNRWREHNTRNYRRIPVR